MEIFQVLFHAYQSFIHPAVKDRFFKHDDLIRVLENLKTRPGFDVKNVGNSFQGRALNLVTCGSGKTKVFLWSQMHGNEATATMALMDLFNFLDLNYISTIKDEILKNCTLFILPMVNPDGAEVFSRRNAQQIDINRDFHSQQSPEGKILRQLRDEIQPDFGINLHDQTTMWSAGATGNPATISLLAPAFDENLSVDQVRKKAMQTIILMDQTLQQLLPGHVGRFDDEYEWRAFGDNFQAAGTSTILIEAGGYANDPEKQQIRKLVFIGMVAGLHAIAGKYYEEKDTAEYFAIPDNKLHHFQIMLRNCQISDPQSGQHYTVDVGIAGKETVSEDLRSTSDTYYIGDLGDLSNRFGYQEIDCTKLKLVQTSIMVFDEPADLVLMDGLEVLLTIEKGVITYKYF